MAKSTHRTVSASDWSYLCEGGHHALFSCGASDERMKGRLLRIRKQDLARSATVRDTSEGHTIERDGTKQEPPQYYLREVVIPLLKPYVDLPDSLKLSWHCVAALRASALESGRIPEGRQEDWSPPDDCTKQFPSPVQAQLLRDYKSMGSNRSTLSCEIKPKAGYRAFSPLVLPKYRAKYGFTRFEIYQQLRLRGRVSKGWEERLRLKEESRYDPCDMFSEDFCRIKESLESLFEAPQNNLRVWCDEKQLLGSGLDEESDEDLSNALELIFGCQAPSTSRRAELADSLIPVLTNVLLHETLLPRLLKLQKLDVLDTDGAVLVFDRLIGLCGKNEAIAFVDTVVAAGGDHIEGTVPLLDPSPFQTPHDCSALLDLCQTITAFAEKLSFRNEGMDVTEMDEARSTAVRQLGALPADSCRYLLQNWLLSLVMCDVSFFIAISPVASDLDLADQGINVDGLSSCGQQGDILVRAQEASAPGVIVWYGNDIDCSQETSTGGRRDVKRMWTYTLRVVDCDQKSAGKLTTRRKKEEPILFFEPTPR